MTQRPRFAGGCFLIAAIMIGAIWGTLTAHVLLGVLIGLSVGVLLALMVWRIDRRPRPPIDDSRRGHHLEPRD